MPAEFVDGARFKELQSRLLDFAGPDAVLMPIIMSSGTCAFVMCVRVEFVLNGLRQNGLDEVPHWQPIRHCASRLHVSWYVLSVLKLSSHYTRDKGQGEIQFAIEECNKINLKRYNCDLICNQVQ